ncbi:SatD family protein [Actinomyces trachealis]|uniref:SatD family protein n=1 Tax=Actinomyces trachealis TaxID=2763540 RepID=UPI00189296EE|nr:SatD family protein [Actinomyces trachealis]
MSMSYAVIADIIASRALPDRAGAQREFENVLQQAATGLNLVQEPYPTVGDEFQALAPNLEAALSLTLLTNLLLSEGLALRFGIGAGQVRTVGKKAAGAIQDGSAWWAAREAIDAAHGAQDAGLGFVRARFRVAAQQADDDADAAADVAQSLPDEALVNAFLVLRDQAVDRMANRPRRLVAHLLMGATQAQAARREGVTQAAVSDLARGSAAGLLQAQKQLAVLGPVEAALPVSRRMRRKAR